MSFPLFFTACRKLSAFRERFFGWEVFRAIFPTVEILSSAGFSAGLFRIFFTLPSSDKGEKNIMGNYPHFIIVSFFYQLKLLNNL